MSRLIQAFVRLTGWIPQWICFRTRIIYEDRSRQSRFIKGPAIIVSNHTAVYDYAVLLFVFFTRTLRYQMAEVLFRKRVLGFFLRLMGGIRIDRNSVNLGFMEETLDILRRGGIVGVFPEGRLPREGEIPPLPFRPGAAFLSMSSGVPVIPVWVDGSYFRRKRAHVVIGTPMDPAEFVRTDRTEKENITGYAEAMRKRVMELKRLCHG